MTSHYMRCIVKSSFENLFEALSKAFGNIYSKKIRKADGLSMGVILGEEYFFRVNSDVAVTIILEETPFNETKVEIISYAGGTGYLGISYSAHSAYVHDVKDFLTHAGFEILVEKEISYFGKGSGGIFGTI